MTGEKGGLPWWGTKVKRRHRGLALSSGVCRRSLHTQWLFLPLLSVHGLGFPSSPVHSHPPLSGSGLAWTGHVSEALSMSACKCAGESSLWARHTWGDGTRVATAKTSHIPAQGLLQVVDTKCLPSGWAFPGPTGALSMLALVLSVQRKEMTEKDKKCPDLVI